MINGLDLFSGIGGLTVALDEWVKPVVYCEQERFCQAVLFDRMAGGQLPTAPIWDDVRTLTRAHINAQIDIIYGGFPCQDISVAGRGVGITGERSGLFYQIARLTSELRPRFVFLENVPAIISNGGQEVVATFTRLGYDCRWCVISAKSVGAPHLRKRWFLLAHPESVGPQGLWASGEQKPDTHGEALLPIRRSQGGSDLWAAEPCVGRVVDGFPGRVDQIKSLGNSVVAQQARKAFTYLTGIGGK